MSRESQSDADWLMETAFKNFDIDSSGAVSVDEFLDFANDMEGIGKMTRLQVEVMISMCDVMLMVSFSLLSSKSSCMAYSSRAKMRTDDGGIAFL